MCAVTHGMNKSLPYFIFLSSFPLSLSPPSLSPSFLPSPSLLLPHLLSFLFSLTSLLPLSLPPSSPPLLFPAQLYSLVLSLEDLERRALSLPEEDRSLVLAQRDEFCSEIFSLLRLKTLDQPWCK